MRLTTCTVMLAMTFAAASARADTQASADVLTETGSVDAFHHTITLTNTGDTPISTFWYAWNDLGLNFLISNPDDITMPAGWNETVTECSAGYFQTTYGIQWYTTTDPIPAGQASSDFGFESNDSADDLTGLSYNNYAGNGYPIGTSFVYMNAPDQPGDFPDGPGSQLIAGTAAVQAPEPATLGIFTLSLIPLLRRTRAFRTNR